MKKWQCGILAVFLLLAAALVATAAWPLPENGIPRAVRREAQASETDVEALVWTQDRETETILLSVPQAGVYALEITYQPMSSQSDFIQLEASLTAGEIQDRFSVELPRPMQYGQIRTMDNGDQIRAETKVSEEIYSQLLRQTDNVTNSVMQWQLPAGEAELVLTGIRTDFVLCDIRLVPAEEIPSYAQVKASPTYQSAKPAGQTLLIEAEEISQASDSSIGALYDRSDPLVSPSDSRNMVLNIAGGSGFHTDGQWMQWRFCVEESGLYTIGFKARQYYKNGLAVNRRIYIDGKVPFAEAENVSFSYSPDWQMVKLQDFDGQDAPVYLEAGVHTLRMEVVPGPQADSIVALTQMVSELTDIYRSVVMITGVNPDRNREYYLERDIPELMEKLQNVQQQLAAQKNRLESLSGTQSGELSSITTLQTQIQSFLEKPETIAVRLGNFKSNIDALSSFMLSISDQPLDIDYILLMVPGSATPKVSAGMVGNLGYEMKSLFWSFFPKADEQEEVLTVWVSVGRDQMQVIKDMTDNVYTAQTGQKVSFSLVQQGITEAILAGTSPDVVLYIGNTEIVTLAMRDALEPLNGYDGLEKIQAQCQTQSLVPYEYNGHYYGVPLTQSFPMMFVRTDIFEELGLEVPQTWEELYACIPAIQRNNMQVGIPSADTTFATMLWQQGQGYYLSDLSATNFNNQTAVDVFRQYTRLYTDYSLPVTYDFYNRFRSGEMPIGITDYTEYNRLLVAAPEITGKWKMYPIPGTQTQTGIDRSVQASGGLGGYVLANSENKQQAVEFLLWFAEAQQQAQYGKQTEALLGAIGRYAPANKTAMAYLPWLPEEQAAIMEQWQYVMEQPQMPGSYYTVRNLANAFRSVVYDGTNYRESLLRYAGEIDRELARKREEYN